MAVRLHAPAAPPSTGCRGSHGGSAVPRQVHLRRGDSALDSRATPAHPLFLFHCSRSLSLSCMHTGHSSNTRHLGHAFDTARQYKSNSQSVQPMGRSPPLRLARRPLVPSASLLCNARRRVRARSRKLACDQVRSLAPLCVPLILPMSIALASSTCIDKKPATHLSICSLISPLGDTCFRATRTYPSATPHSFSSASSYSPSPRVHTASE